ncbi:hypothetical protein MA16_Dca003777 [Dendrobium catenatum]|uniref:Uncharacterized protein n=1 Tax=Dendrobium catenatum TaxID=906689 RepID=A0A2I0WFX1_9ASPA|nr:hypothetical protein MA16_Dca003777 [Dendrobium catenatum]
MLMVPNRPLTLDLSKMYYRVLRLQVICYRTYSNLLLMGFQWFFYLMRKFLDWLPRFSLCLSVNLVYIAQILMLFEIFLGLSSYLVFTLLVSWMRGMWLFSYLMIWIIVGFLLDVPILSITVK